MYGWYGMYGRYEGLGGVMVHRPSLDRIRVVHKYDIEACA